MTSDIVIYTDHQLLLG